jgi:hypothetical protein
MFLETSNRFRLAASVAAILFYRLDSDPTAESRFLTNLLCHIVRHFNRFVFLRPLR